jgi:flavorubredoxin
VQHAKTGKNIPNDHKINQMATKYTEWSQNIPNGRKIYQMAVHKIYQKIVHRICQHLPTQDPPKSNQIGSFGLKIYNLATLVKTVF